MGAWDRPAETEEATSRAADRTPPIRRGPEPKVGDQVDQPREHGDDRPRVLSDGSWEWQAKDLRLSPADNATADGALAERRSAEGRDVDGNYGDRGITPAMRRIEADLEHGELEGCPEFALKEPDRFKEKLARGILEDPDHSAAEHAAMVPDGIRYTFAFDSDHYTAGAGEVIDRLEDGGYEMQQLKNWWNAAEYKGINSRWRDPDSGQLFEVQFHTHESWAAKQDTHDTYEKIANTRTSEAERAELRASQERRSAAIPLPVDVFEIQDHRRDER